MAKKNDPTKTSPTGRQQPERIAPSAVEISVARNGFLKPYATCLQQLPDNISREPLGLLAGVFSIGNRSENSAYIVNFLASLAKKEYYSNPRRDAVESFESALHKVNIGLSELAKEGNTDWIGTIDAAICAVERNNLHFSLAGNAKALLFREGRLSDIGDGLSGNTEHHPMKTFTDVASGKVSPGDRILITTPELLSATSELEIERSANRLSGEPFERFLRTAAVNKLDLSATILITIGAVEEYRHPIEPKRTLATVNAIPNAWSRTVFDTSKRRGGNVEEELREKIERRKDRIDDKTGHIYVTGETPEKESNELLEHSKIIISDSIRSTIFSLRRSSSRATSFIQNISQSFIYSIRAHLISIQERRQKKTLARKHPSDISRYTEPSDETLPGQFLTDIKKNELGPNIQTSNTEIETSFIHTSILDLKSKVLTRFSKITVHVFRTIPRSFFQKESKIATEPLLKKSEPEATGQSFQYFGAHFFKHIPERISPFFHSVSHRWNALPLKFQRAIFLIFGCIIIILGSIFLNFPGSNSSIPEKQTSPVPSAPLSPDPSPLSNEPSLRFLAEPPVIFQGNNLLDIVQFEEILVFIGQSSLSISGRNGGNGIQVVYPEGLIVRASAAMPDINLLFLLGEDGRLFSFAPSTKAFTLQNISLPAVSSISDIAIASTYLYITNHQKDSILRFPRTEGGFGDGKEWLKQSVPIETDTKIAVSDSIYLSENSGIQAFFRGDPKNISFAPSITPISTTDFFADTKNPSLFVLDGVNGRIVEYHTETGSILNQYASNTLKGSIGFTVEPIARIAFVALPNSTLLVEMR